MARVRTHLKSGAQFSSARRKPETISRGANIVEALYLLGLGGLERSFGAKSSDISNVYWRVHTEGLELAAGLRQAE